MARRVLEKELLEKNGIEIPPLDKPNKITLIKEIKLHNTFRGVFSLQFNYTGEILVVGFGSGGIQQYEGKTGKMVKELRACRQGGHSIMALRFHPKQPDILYAVTTNGEILIYNVNTAENIGLIEEKDNEINTLDFCVDGFNFATGGRDLGVRVYETKMNKIVQNYVGFAHKTTPNVNTVIQTMRIFCIKFHPDNQYIFISGGWDNQLKIWDTRANDGIKRHIMGPHICGEAIDMMNNNILSGQWAALHSLQEYDYTSGKIVRELKYPHTDGAFLYCSQYCNSNLVIAGGSGTKRVELIDIPSNETVGGFDFGAAIQALDSAQNGRIFSVGGAKDSFYIFSVSD